MLCEYYYSVVNAPLASKCSHNNEDTMKTEMIHYADVNNVFSLGSVQYSWSHCPVLLHFKLFIIGQIKMDGWMDGHHCDIISALRRLQSSSSSSTLFSLHHFSV